MSTIDNLAINLILIGSGSFLIALLLTPLLAAWALRKGWVDQPGNRKIHLRGTPRIGGGAIFVGILLPLVSFMVLNGEEIRQTIPHMRIVPALLAAGTGIWLLGIYDDLVGAKAWQKFSLQTLAAYFLYTEGVRIEELTNPLGGSFSLGLLSLPVTLLWIVGVSNAFNLIDGIDGLAAGVGMFTAAILAVIAALNGQILITFVATGLAGALLGFLPFNFHPARIFMGDSGSLLVGFILGSLSIFGNEKGTTAVATLVPIIALGLPIMDTFIVMARRFIQGKALFQADREHIHHRLLSLGYTQRRAALVLYGFTVLSGVAALVMAVGKERSGIVLVLLLGAVAATAARRLGYIDLTSVVGRIRSGNKRRRTPRYKNLFVRKMPGTLRRVRELEHLKPLLVDVQKELELDLVRLSFDPFRNESLNLPGAFECQSLPADNGGSGKPAGATDEIWSATVPLNGKRGVLGELTVGKFAWKRRRRGEDDEEWAQQVAEAISRWVQSHCIRTPQMHVQFLKDLQTWPDKWVVM